MRDIPLWLKGSVRIQVSGSFCERFFNLCAYHNIALRKLKRTEEGYEADISLSDFRNIRPLVRKCHIKLRISHRWGFPFLVKRYRKRKFLFLSFTAAGAMIFFLSLFIWDIRIEGNQMLTDETIVSYLYSSGIHQGVRKTSLHCKELAAQLREQFPEMTWVSVKIQGTRLLINLQESTDTDLVSEEDYGPSNLVSSLEGTVVHLIVRAGTPMVSVGDEIQEGDLLVSGEVDLINDAGEVYAKQYVPADADIYVKTSIHYRETFPLKQKEKIYTGRSSTRHLFQIGNLRLGIPFFLRSYEQYDCIREKKQFRVMDNFYLPFYLSQITAEEYEIKEVIYTQEEGKRQLESGLEQFLENFQEKGVQIFQNNVKIDTTASMCKAEGDILLIEKSGKRVGVEITAEQKERTLTE